MAQAKQPELTAKDIDEIGANFKAGFHDFIAYARDMKHQSEEVAHLIAQLEDYRDSSVNKLPLDFCHEACQRMFAPKVALDQVASNILPLLKEFLRLSEKPQEIQNKHGKDIKPFLKKLHNNLLTILRSCANLTEQH